MDQERLVSVAIIFLDAEQFLDEAIASVLAQTHHEWNLLLVDDGSSDGSSEIARRYARENPDRVRYLEHEHHRNRGMPASRNLGIRAARGRYIAFLDADDVWLPHKLEDQVALIEKHPEAGMVCGSTEYWYSWTARPRDTRRDFIVRVGVVPDTLVQPPQLALRLQPLAKGMGPHASSSVLSRTEVVVKLGGYEEQFRGIHHMYEDQSFLIKMYLAAPVYVADACWHRHRQHSSSFSASLTTGKRRAATDFFLTWLEAHLSAKGYEDYRVWRALQRAQWRHEHPLLELAVNAPDQLIRYVRSVAYRTIRQALPAKLFRRARAEFRAIRRKRLTYG